MKNRKNRIRNYVILGSVLTVAVLAVILSYLFTKKAPDPALPPDSETNVAAGTSQAAQEQQSESAEEQLPDNKAGKPEGIRVVGYPRITIQADTEEVTMNLKNPEGNPCYFTFEIVLTQEEETLFTSEPVKPGEAVTNVTLSRALERGEYPAMIRITTTSLTDGTAMNGATVETVLVVQ